MRSRYTAYVKGHLDYIRKTMAPEKRREFDEASVREWMDSEWLGLEVVKVQGSKVEFVAKYRAHEKMMEHHEVALFRKDEKTQQWYFVDGDAHEHEEGQGHHHPPQQPIVRESAKIGRNDPCTCGSGKKFKKCCG